MKKDFKYGIYLFFFIGVYIVIQLLSPQSRNWNITMAPNDKNPFGAYALDALLPALFDSISKNNLTIYELLRTQPSNFTLLSLSTSLDMGKADTDALLDYISKGNTALLSAHYFGGQLADTLNLQTTDPLFGNQEITLPGDTTFLHFVNPLLDTTHRIRYRNDQVRNHFSAFDTTQTTVVATNAQQKPVTLNVALGKGHLYLNCTPMVFTNINLLSHDNDAFASTSLSYLHSITLNWTAFYQLGRMEAATPLRFILTKEPLAWAYYLIIAALLLFILFEVKRKQRVIPIVLPPRNTTMDFVSTLGNLYFQHGDHKNLAHKKITFFQDTLRARYYLDSRMRDEDYIKAVARKTGNSEITTSLLFGMIKNIQNKETITADELVTLNRQIEDFIK